MPTPPLSDELAQQAADAFRMHGRKKEAAESLGLPWSTFDKRLKHAALRGMLLDTPAAMPGFRVSRVAEGPRGRTVEQKPERGEQFAVPAGHVVKGVSALVDEDGREVVKWIKTKEGVLDPLQLAERLKDAFADAPTTPRMITPSATADDLLTLLPCGDWHLGLYTWGRETAENWDLRIAEDKIGSAIDTTVGRTEASSECVVLVGGDLLHADNKENQTARSGHALDVDGRYQKVMEVATRLMARTVDAARFRHKHVIVRVLPGNHDEHSAVAIAYFLQAYYRDEPRVTIDTDPSLFWWHRFGNVMLGATHGHTVKITQMPAIMAHRRAADWGATKFRYIHGFHLHHAAKTQTEGGGCITEIHQAPIPQDAWHYGAGFLSGRSVSAITYHREFGEMERHRTAIMDGAQE